MLPSGTNFPDNPNPDTPCEERLARDEMVIRAVALLDDVDKELNTYAMRVREWYGWHFPELGNLVTDNQLYAKFVKFIGNRSNASKLDLSGVLPAEMVREVKEAAQMSIGTEISEGDMENISSLCDKVISLAEYRAELCSDLKSRMVALAPSLTATVGAVEAARYIAHAGSLSNLARNPTPTVQVLDAEKALFRALKNRNETPEDGLIYHAATPQEPGEGPGRAEEPPTTAAESGEGDEQQEASLERAASKS